MKITKDTKVWDQMKRNLLKGSNTELRIGFFESDKYDDSNGNLPVAQIAKWNDQGSEKNPQRPFLTGSAGFMGAVRGGMYDSYFIESMQRIAEGTSTFAQEYRRLGPMMKEDVQDLIDKWDSPPNSPRTIERKGFNNPLVDTGLMHDSVSWMVGNE